jgi:5-methylcytosine-specific restriction endonuclease McrA
MLSRIPLPNQAKQEESPKAKRCSKCKETKPITGFHKFKRSKDGYKSACKVCRNAAKAKYYAENAEKERASQAKYYAENREKKLAYQVKYRKDNPDKVRAHRHQRRAVKANASGTHTASDWKAKLEYYGYRCRYCGIHKSETSEGWLEADHAIPLSRGGTNFISNIVPACRSCNASKHAKTFKDYLNGQQNL